MKNTLKTLLELFSIFLYVAFFTIGGGVAMLPILEKILVEKKKYLHEKDFLELFSLTQILPGSFMIHMATFIGYRIAGLPGATVCCVAIALPPLIIITLIAMFFTQWIQYPLVKKLMLGILAGVVGEVSGSVLKMVRRTKFDTLKIVLLVLTFVLIFIAQINPISVMIIAGLSGIASGIIWGAKK